MRKVLKLMIIWCLIMMLSGCSLIVGKEEASKHNSVSTSANAPFGVVLPDGWQLMPQGELNAYSDLEALNNDEMYFLAMMELKSGLEVDLVGYRDVVVQMNEENYGVSLGEAKATKVGNYDAYVNEFEIENDGYKTHMWLYSVETENYYGQLFAWTLADQLDRSKDELMSVVNSFVEVQEE